MFARNGVLIVAAYLLIGVVVFGIGFAALSFYRPEPQDEATAGGRPSAAKPAAAARATPGSSAGYNTTALVDAHQQLNALQAKLQETSDLLEKRTASLTEKTVQCEALRSELDASINLAIDLLESEADRFADHQDADRQQEDQWQQELQQITARFEQSDLLARQHALEVERLRAELMQAELALAELQDKADRELVSLIQQQHLLETAATDALAALGANAVPSLVELLGAESPEARRWAALVLGEIGPDAREAVTALRGLRRDPDETVRRQAQRSLARIEP